MGDEPAIDVMDVPDRNRYEILATGELVGFAVYRRQHGVTAFTHTEIRPEAGHHGFGSALARAALIGERDAGRTVIPYCPFIAGYIDKHPEYLALVDPAHRSTGQS